MTLNRTTSTERRHYGGTAHAPLGVDVSDWRGLSGRLTYYPPGLRMPHHEHGPAHLSLVLAGGFEETIGGRDADRLGGDRLHRREGARHALRFGPHGSLVMNVKLTEPSLGSDEDFGRQPPADWLNEVRRAIETSPWSASISALARSAGVHRVHLHRQFRKAYGIAPASFRTRSMVGHAIMLTLMEDRPLAEAGLTAGFADQSHLTRAVKAVCGLPIGRLRRLMSVQAA